jgi:hypothetical protein
MEIKLVDQLRCWLSTECRTNKNQTVEDFDAMHQVNQCSKFSVILSYGTTAVMPSKHICMLQNCSITKSTLPISHLVSFNHTCKIYLTKYRKYFN